MSNQTQEQKDIVEIKGDLIGIKGEITSIRRHFDEFKKKQDLEDLSRISRDNMIRELPYCDRYKRSKFLNSQPYWRSY